MKNTLFILFLLVFSCSLFAITDQEIQDKEATYRQNCLKVAQRYATPEYYYSKNPDGSYFIYDSQPEVAIGMHGLDEVGAEQMNQVGIKFIRKTMYWAMMEDNKEPYTAEWHWHEKLCKDYDLVPVAVVHGAPAKFDYNNRKECYKAFGDYMAWCAGEFKEIRYWQLWNEMDLLFTDIFGAKRVSIDEIGKNYVEMLKIAYPKIKKANPDAIVVLGPPIYPEFIQAVYKAGGKDYFDIVSMHSYSTPTKWEFVRKGLMARFYMNKFGDNYKPLWNTEFGTEAGKYYGTYGKLPEGDPLAFFDRMQRDEIAECININNILGLYNKAFIFQYESPAEGYVEELSNAITFPEGDNIQNYSFSIVRQNRVPRPSFIWLLDNQPNKKNKPSRKVTVKIGKFTKEVEVHPEYPTRIYLK